MSDSIELGVVPEDGGVGRGERADAAANRRLILQTADALFARRGVANVNMADIAQAAGVGKGTLYRRFSNKAELCLALMDTQLADFQNAMLGRMRQMAANGQGNVEMLDQFLDALVHFTENHTPLLCEVQSAGLLATELRLQMPHFWQYMTVDGLLKAAIQAGEIRPDLDVDYLADALLAPLRADMFRFQRTVRGFSLERISDGLRSLVQGLTI